MALFPNTGYCHAWPGRVAAAGLLIALMLAAVGLITLPDPAPVRAAATSELSQKLEEARARLQKVRADIARAQLAKKAALGDIAALDERIEGLEQEVEVATDAWDAATERLATLQAQLKKVAIDIDAKQAELVTTQNDLERQQETFDTRLLNVYKSGGRVVYLAALLEPHSLSELVGRIDLLSAVADQDSNILSQIRTLKARVEERKRELEQKRARVASLEEDQAIVVEDLKSRARELEASLGDLEDAKTAKQKALRAVENELAAWNKQEDALLEESDRIGGLLRAAAGTAKTAEVGKGVLVWPVEGQVSSGFGYRIHPIFQVRKLHTGIDISAYMGQTIRAASGGTVVSAGWRGGYGKCVVIQHAGGLATLYAHQSEIMVLVGEKVERGEVIGKVGSTGYSTGPHLHFEVRVNGSPVNPMGYL